MTLNFLNDLGNFLQAKLVGTLATDIFLERMPPSPDNLVGVFLTGGQVIGSRTIDVIRFQVLVRDSSITSGLTRAETIWNLLQNSWGELSTSKARITADGQPGIKFRDSNELLVFSLNFTASVPR